MRSAAGESVRFVARARRRAALACACSRREVRCVALTVRSRADLAEQLVLRVFCLDCSAALLFFEQCCRDGRRSIIEAAHEHTSPPPTSPTRTPARAREVLVSGVAWRACGQPSMVGPVPWRVCLPLCDFTTWHYDTQQATNGPTPSGVRSCGSRTPRTRRASPDRYRKSSVLTWGTDWQQVHARRGDARVRIDP